MAIEIAFALRFGADDFRFSDQWPDAGPDADKVVEDDFYGRLVVRQPGEPEGFFQDDLLPLIAGACFQSIEFLAAGEPWIAWATRYDGTLGLRPDGDMVTATLEDEVLFRAPARELLPALVDGGQRAMALLRPLVLRAPYGEDSLKGLEGLAEEAERALAGSS